MRVLPILLALVATPFVAGVSQGLGHDAAHCARRADQHPGKVINKCDPAPAPVPVPSPTPPPSCQVTAQPTMATESGKITGTVYLDVVWTTISGVCVHLSGVSAAGAQISATVLTDANGLYTFSGVPGGSYTVCEDTNGMSVTWPAAGMSCIPVSLAAGNWAAFNDWANAP
ncbi:MAG: hypothetical protein AUI55_07345 [Gemmatimonadetes bacterium 13_1_40CM_2_70_7]|nr:MAG: hypothetical protein AUI55_07345 [Gemmatimonadetes bacterium 13_1_40CM_2_70_7]PYO39834.1 MAG: hypothetical protein DMD29_07645 [Gemmatimonadota bacterium]